MQVRGTAEHSRTRTLRVAAPSSKAGTVPARTLQSTCGRQPRGARTPAGGRSCLRASPESSAMGSSSTHVVRVACQSHRRVSEGLGPPHRAPIARASARKAHACGARPYTRLPGLLPLRLSGALHGVAGAPHRRAGALHRHAWALLRVAGALHRGRNGGPPLTPATHPPLEISAGLALTSSCHVDLYSCQCSRLPRTPPSFPRQHSGTQRRVHHGARRQTAARLCPERGGPTAGGWRDNGGGGGRYRRWARSCRCATATRPARAAAHTGIGGRR